MVLKYAKRTNARATPQPMNARDLIETAHGLTELSPRRPSQANLRRAQSTAYYAVFHCLAATVANALMEDSPGWPHVHFMPKSEIGRRDPATVFSGPAPYGCTSAG